MVAVQELISEVEGLSEENFKILRLFANFLKYQDELMPDDNTYLASIPGMMESIREGVNAPREEYVPIEEVWPDVFSQPVKEIY